MRPGGGLFLFFVCHVFLVGAFQLPGLVVGVELPVDQAGEYAPAPTIGQIALNYGNHFVVHVKNILVKT